MDREFETKKLLCNNLYVLRKEKGVTRRTVAIACGKKEDSGAANCWGSNIELLANLTGQEDETEISRRAKKCPFLSVQDLLNISELLQISPVEMLTGAENLYNLPVEKDDDERKIEISEMMNRLNDEGIQRVLDYLKDLIRINEYTKQII